MELDPPALGDRASGDLPARALRGSAIAIAAQGAKLALQFAATPVLARLLTPRDYGIAALAISVSAALGIFADLGLTAATVQARTLDHRQLSALFWLNAATGLALSILLAVLAYPASVAFQEPAVRGVLLALAPVFLIGGLRAQHAALLARRMAFGRIAAAELTAACAGAATGILAAVHGWGVYALVLQSLTSILVELGALWLLCSWTPGVRVRLAGVREMLAFGGHLTGFNIVNYAARNVDNLLVGRVWGAETLGLYSRAYSLMLLPNLVFTTPLQRVMVPALAKLQHDHERFEHAFVRSIQVLAAITFPLGIGMAILSEEAIALYLGPAWSSAVPLLRILAINASLQPLLSSTGWAYLALGRTDRLLRWALLSLPIILASFAIGLPWGALGLAWSYTLAMCCLVLPLGLVYAFHVLNMRLRRFLLPLLGPFLAALVMGSAVYGLRQMLQGSLGILPRACVLVAMGAVAYAAALGIFSPALIREVISFASSLRARQPAKEG